MTLTLERVEAPTTDVRELVGQLELELSKEYPPDQRHGLVVDALFQPNIRFFVARLDETAVGCGGVALFPDFAEVKRMYVREDARGRGVARALLARIEEETVDAGLSLLRLETGTRQFIAVKFYERSGFFPCAKFGTYEALPASALLSSLFFEKRLAAAEFRRTSS
jgi:putative acetyltransferase